MTHEGLLARLGCTCCSSSEGLALRAVVELHKPEPQIDETLIRKEILVCGHCSFDKSPWAMAYRYNYPCPTIKAIEKSLE